MQPSLLRATPPVLNIQACGLNYPRLKEIISTGPISLWKLEQGQQPVGLPCQFKLGLAPASSGLRHS
ncbi:hypothetical protein ACFX1T_003748 [Malus domestica]